MQSKNSPVSSLESKITNGYYRISKDELPEMERYCERYKAFLSVSRTERTTAANAIRLAESKGFVPYQTGMDLKPGDRIYYNNRDKSLCLAVMGRQPLADGMTMVVSHIDSPRLDIRPRPFRQDNDLAYLKTHYYGWLRKYQWVALPLMLSGVVYLSSGEKVVVSIGDAPEDPQFVITDLLPHVSAEQNKLPLAEAHTAEQMNILIASTPLEDCEQSKAIKLQALKILNDKYGITEDDFLSAELEVVPALPVRDLGLDRSMIGAYGQDDRVCAYSALEALFQVEVPNRTAVCVLADKEEIGNIGITGMCSAAFDLFFEDLCQSQGCSRAHCYNRSFCLSSDVTAAYDPNYADAFEVQNCAHANRGIAVCKYTGFRGKEQGSDASAELVNYVRQVFDREGVLWQTAEMCRLDLGGGGTVALELANRGIDTLDAGVPLFSMHSPFEVSAKLDCYMNYKACKALYNN